MREAAAYGLQPDAANPFEAVLLLLLMPLMRCWRVHTFIQFGACAREHMRSAVCACPHEFNGPAVCISSVCVRFAFALKWFGGCCGRRRLCVCVNDASAFCEWNGGYDDGDDVYWIDDPENPCVCDGRGRRGLFTIQLCRHIIVAIQT